MSTGCVRPSLVITGAGCVAADHRRHPVGVEGGRHGQDAQVGAQRVACVEGEGEGEVGLEVAFVDLVEDHHSGAGEGRVPLEAAGQDALGDHLDAGVPSDVALVAGAVTDGAADLLTEQVGHASRGSTGGQASGFEHHDPPAVQPRLGQQAQRHDGGLAGSRWGLEHRGRGLAQGRSQVLDGGFDREGREGAARGDGWWPRCRHRRSLAVTAPDRTSYS